MEEISKKEFLEKAVQNEYPDRANEILAKFEKAGLLNDDRKMPVPSYVIDEANGISDKAGSFNEPATFVLGIDAGKSTVSVLEQAIDYYSKDKVNEFVERAENIIGRKIETQDDRVAQLKDVKAFYDKFGQAQETSLGKYENAGLPTEDPSYSITPSMHILNLDEDMTRILQEGKQSMIAECLPDHGARQLRVDYHEYYEEKTKDFYDKYHNYQGWGRNGMDPDIYRERYKELYDKAHTPPTDEEVLKFKLAELRKDVTGRDMSIAKDLLINLAHDTQGITHNEIAEDFEKYQIKGLDSIQLKVENNYHGRDEIQLTLSNDKFFNAEKISIPTYMIGKNELPAILSGAAKYSQTQNEFEQEMKTSYESCYNHGNSDSHCSVGIEPLGNARYNEDIPKAMEDALSSELYSGQEKDDLLNVTELVENAGYTIEKEMPETEMQEEEHDAQELDDDFCL